MPTPFWLLGKKDFMFFVLSTRMLPPVAIIVPLYMVYARIGLADTRLGMILLYTMMGLGLSTWIMKGSSMDSYGGWRSGVCKRLHPISGISQSLSAMVKGGIAATADFVLSSPGMNLRLPRLFPQDMQLRCPKNCRGSGPWRLRLGHGRRGWVHFNFTCTDSIYLDPETYFNGDDIWSFGTRKE